MHRFSDPQRRSDVPPPTAARVGRIATGQYGVVHRTQLAAHGIAPRTIDRWLASGRLLKLHPGVYAVGHAAFPDLAPVMAAVLATARWDRDHGTHRGAAASHTAAAVLLDVRDRGRRGGTVHVTTETRRTARGVIVHHTRRLDPADVTTIRGVPVTTFARTAIDLAEMLEPHWLERTLERAAVKRVLDESALQSAMDRHAGRRGIGPLRAALATGRHLDPQTCDSVLEELFLNLIRRAERPGLPHPQMQRTVRLSGGERFRVDALWRALRVVVELDSRWHDPAGARLRDRARDRALRRDGYLVYRFRYADVVQRPGWVVATVRSLLAEAAYRRVA
ncbi:type IV toxin-antitoxin system AbiEi family antitoxin domain-containing protein [Paraconexibacter sp.]|uniref:type IV toxin-antitoxin system AbiEi family antitoxin domain-containing protein n=1 Tax=Paraconexibacter sp. TaxID=2949640 RepID=UPI00356A465F